jgi:coatomer protein complex subunit gamma
MRKISQLKELGEPCRTIEPLLLTEADNEYVVTLFKHIFPEHIVLQFKVHNTMDNIALEKITIQTDISQLEAEPLFAIPIDHLAPSATEYGYVVLRYEEDRFPSGPVSSAFSFRMKEGEDDAGEEEEYPMEEFAINLSDFVAPLNLGGSFESMWVSLKEHESVDKFSLKAMRNLTQAAHQLIDFFGMHVEGGRPEKISTKSHVINMSGVLADSKKTVVLVSGKVFVASDNSVALQLEIRGGDEGTRSFLSQALTSS